MGEVFRYKHVGDTPLVLRGKLVNPGEEIEEAEEVINGNFELVGPSKKPKPAPEPPKEA